MSKKKPYTEPAIIGEYPYDPALADHLTELEAICREMGAIDLHVLRDTDMAWLYYEAGGTVGELRLPGRGVIFIARFTASDGGEPGLKHPNQQTATLSRSPAKAANNQKTIAVPIAGEPCAEPVEVSPAKPCPKTFSSSWWPLPTNLPATEQSRHPMTTPFRSSLGRAWVECEAYRDLRSVPRPAERRRVEPVETIETLNSPVARLLLIFIAVIFLPALSATDLPAPACAGLLTRYAQASTACWGAPPTPTPAPDLTARVVRVIDGDTVVLEGGEHLRYLGIDTPELNECYGQKALAANAGLVEDGILLLYFDRQKRDRYHRLLAYAFLADGTFVNVWLVRQGYATTWILSPNIAQGHTILDAENDARSAGRGLWSACP